MGPELVAGKRHDVKTRASILGVQLHQLRVVSPRIPARAGDVGDQDNLIAVILRASVHSGRGINDRQRVFDRFDKNISNNKQYY